MKPLDISGQRFGRLTAVDYIETINKKSYWHFKCDCGNTIRARADVVKYGKTLSCGCLHSESARKQAEQIHKNDNHHDSQTQFYHIYQSAKRRCNNPNNKRYDDYGGRGIKFEWNSYLEFKKDMYDSYLEFIKGHPDFVSIDRIDNNGNYCKDNCRWATRVTQCNNRRSNVIVEFQNGSTMTLSQYADSIGIKRSTMIARYHRSKYFGTKRVPVEAIATTTRKRRGK